MTPWLLCAWAALLFGGFALGRTNEPRTRRSPAWTRLCSSLVLVVLAWDGWRRSGIGPAGQAALCVALGMSLCCLGDVCLVRVERHPARLLPGMGAFALGHAGYIRAFLLLAGLRGLAAPPAMWVCPGAVAALALVEWRRLAWQSQVPMALRWAALGYALLLASMCGLALALGFQSRAGLPLAAGGLLFLASDWMLAARIFRGWSPPLIEEWVWLSYGTAQALIVTSAGLGHAD